MEIVWRAALVYVFLLVVMRLIGRRTLGEMSAFELVVLVTMGDLVQQGVTQEDYSLTGAFLAVGTFALLTVALSWTSWRFPRARRPLEGLAVVVVQEGRLRPDVMRYERLPESELHEAMREQGIDDVAQVRMGVLEPDGKFSFITYDGESEPAPEKHAG